MEGFSKGFQSLVLLELCNNQTEHLSELENICPRLRNLDMSYNIIWDYMYNLCFETRNNKYQMIPVGKPDDLKNSNYASGIQIGQQSNDKEVAKGGEEDDGDLQRINNDLLKAEDWKEDLPEWIVTYSSNFQLVSP